MFVAPLPICLGPRRQQGFTLLELMIVMTIVGILAALAVPQYRNSTRKARESVLREDLWAFRNTIDQYKADKGNWPHSLDDLVSAGYLRKIPIDPITKTADTWVTVPYEPPEPAADDNPDNAGGGDSGFWDVKSGAPGTTLDGVAYGDL